MAQPGSLPLKEGAETMDSGADRFPSAHIREWVGVGGGTVNIQKALLRGSLTIIGKAPWYITLYC